jgi:hypothetical protein
MNTHPPNLNMLTAFIIISSFSLGSAIEYWHGYNRWEDALKKRDIAE